MIRGESGGSTLNQVWLSQDEIGAWIILYLQFTSLEMAKSQRHWEMDPDLTVF